MTPEQKDKIMSDSWEFAPYQLYRQAQNGEEEDVFICHHMTMSLAKEHVSRLQEEGEIYYVIDVEAGGIKYVL